MDEPTRTMPHPQLQPDGSTRGRLTLTPKELTTRALFTLPPSRVIPVIVLPGTMGSNLRATTNPAQPQNQALAPGEEAWRPPNGSYDGYNEGNKWGERNAALRQRILDHETLEVDDQGEIDLPMLAAADGIGAEQSRERGWGQAHWDSYGALLYTLERNLNATFYNFNGTRTLESHWQVINSFDRERWGWPGAVTGVVKPLLDSEFEQFAKHHFPVYAHGYNWMASNEDSARLLQSRIERIIAFWAGRKQVCTQVILVTHSMGGLVARACAKNIPNSIAGIIHGVMPTLGAPVCFSRIACGTETTRPGAGKIETIALEVVAKIVGPRTEDTTAVMATAPGALELLPTHLYQRKWLHIASSQRDAPANQHFSLPEGNPYDFYRDTKPWYRLIDPALADPADKYKANLAHTLRKTVDQAERFHRQNIDTYYHPNTYAFYGDDALPTFGEFRWTAIASLAGKSVTAIKAGRGMGNTFGGGRSVMFPDSGSMYFERQPQDANGDGTVPSHSGAGPLGKIKHLFATRGYDHQGCYNDKAMIALTQHLIVRIVQDLA